MKMFVFLALFSNMAAMGSSLLALSVLFSLLLLPWLLLLLFDDVWLEDEEVVPPPEAAFQLAASNHKWS